MAAKREERAFLPVVLLHDAATGQRVCINALWLVTYAEMHGGTLVRLQTGDPVLVEETFDMVARLFHRGVG